MLVFLIAARLNNHLKKNNIFVIHYLLFRLFASTYLDIFAFNCTIDIILL